MPSFVMNAAGLERLEDTGNRETDIVDERVWVSPLIPLLLAAVAANGRVDCRFEG